MRSKRMDPLYYCYNIIIIKIQLKIIKYKISIETAREISYYI